MKKTFISLFLLSLLTVFGSLSVKADPVKTLSFVYTSAGNDKYCNGNDSESGKGAVGGDFQWSGKIEDAIQKSGDWMGVNGNTTACSRSTSKVHLDATGDYTFTMDVKWTEHGNHNLPRITIAGQSEKTPDMGSSVYFDDNETKTIVYTFNELAAGDYDISVYFQDGARDKQFVQTLVISSSAPAAPTYEVSATASNGTVSGTGSFAEGATVTLTPNPNPYYAFSSWSGLTGVSVDDYEDDNPLTFTMPAGEVSVTATFVSSPCTNTKTIQCEDETIYRINSSLLTKGTPTPTYGTSHSHYSGADGDYVDFKGTAGEHYYMVHLPAATYSFTVYKAHAGNSWLNIWEAGLGDALTYNGVNYGKHHGNGYNIIGDDAGDQNTPIHNSTVSDITLTEGDYIIGLYGNEWAAFDKIVITATSNVFCNYTITMADGVNGGKPTSDVASAAEGATVTVTAGDPESGYYFSGWSASPSVTFSVSTSPATFTMPASNVTITANYSEIISSTFTYTTSGSGSITCLTASDASVASGTEISMTAVPSSEYVFKGWTATAGSFSDPYALTTTFTMPAEAATVTATFAQVDNKIIIGDVASTEGFDGDGNGTMNITTEADFDAFGHNVLKFAYSDMDDGKYKGRKILINDGYSPASSAGATGFGFYYKTEKADDNVAFCFEVSSGQQVKWELQATNNEWKYFYFPHAGANSWNGGHIAIFMNGDDTGNYSTWDKQGTHTTYKNGGAFYMSEIAATTITSKPDIDSYTYTRNSIPAYGTLCLPMAGTVTGATLYSVAGKQVEDAKLYIVLEEQDNLEAGEPYIFEANGSTLTATMSGPQSEVSDDANGLVGTYTEITAPAYSESGDHNYVLAPGNDDNVVFKKVGSNVTVGAYRAYININDVSAFVPAPAMGRRYIRFGVEGQEQVVAIEMISDDASMHNSKVLQNGQLFIIRDGHIFNAQGTQIK